VDLGGLDRKLRGVVVLVPEPVLVGSMARTATILGALPEATASEDEARIFVGTLLAANRIAYEGKSTRQGIRSATTSDQRKRLPTHAVQQMGATKVLRRIRFAC
jgi:hypothetical protein